MHKPTYVQTIRLIERLHQALHENIRAEFASMGWDDINPRQALLFNIGKGNEVLSTEIRAQSLHIGSNPAYNIKQLVGGYSARSGRKGIAGASGSADRQGEEVCEVVTSSTTGTFARYPPPMASLDRSRTSGELARLERFWSGLTSGNVVL